jgi:hypothetical protein
MPPRTQLRRSSTAVAPNAITSILLVIAGLLLVFGLHAGLVLVLPPYSRLSLEALPAPGCY